MRLIGASLVSLLLLGLVGPACSSQGDDGESGEAALSTCTLPDPGPLKAAATWVPPGGFVNVEAPGDGVEIRVEKMPNAVGTSTIRKFGISGQPSFVIEFDAASKGFFRVVASRKGQDLGEVRIRVSAALPRLELGVKTKDGKIDPVATLSGSSAALAGSITDELGSPAIVAIDGNKQDVKGGQFAVTMKSDPGLHLVDAQVIDAACNTYPVTGAFVAATSRGGDAHLRVRANQTGVDTVIALVEDHFTEIVKVPAQSAPIANTLGQSLFFDGVDFPTAPGAVHLKVTVGQNRLGLHLAIDGELVAHARLNSTPVPVTIDNFSLDGTLSISSSGQFSLSVSNVGGDVHADVGAFPVPLLGLFQGVIHKAIGDAVAKMAPGLIQGALAGQKGDIPFALPWASSKPASIHYALGPIGATSSSFTADLHTTVPNSPQFAKANDTPAPPDGELGVGISYATINQALYSVWVKGEFNPQLGAADIAKFETGTPLPAFIKDAQIDVGVDNPAVPPVVLAAPDGKSIRVGVGSLPLHLFAQGSGLSTKIDAEVDVTADFAVSGSGDTLAVSLVHADPHARLTGRVDVNASLDDVTALMKDVGVRMAGLLAMNSMSIQIPAFDLSATGIPALKGTQVMASNVGVSVAPAGVAAHGTATVINPK